MRVQLVTNFKRLSNLRIIPACAGTTFYIVGIHLYIRDHPPRVRVQPETVSVLLTVSRIIPACAGTTTDEERMEALTEDHPRVCGYNLSQTSSASPTSGSSPRVRVQLFATEVKFENGGIIPACAGTTW